MCSLFASENMVSGNYGCAGVQRNKSHVGCSGLEGLGTELGVDLRGPRGACLGCGRAGQSSQAPRSLPKGPATPASRQENHETSPQTPFLASPSHPRPARVSGAPGSRQDLFNPQTFAPAPLPSTQTSPGNWGKGYGVGQPGLHPGHWGQWGPGTLGFKPLAAGELR